MTLKWHQTKALFRLGKFRERKKFGQWNLLEILIWFIFLDCMKYLFSDFACYCPCSDTTPPLVVRSVECVHATTMTEFHDNKFAVLTVLMVGWKRHVLNLENYLTGIAMKNLLKSRIDEHENECVWVGGCRSDRDDGGYCDFVIAISLQQLSMYTQIYFSHTDSLCNISNNE